MDNDCNTCPAYVLPVFTHASLRERRNRLIYISPIAFHEAAYFVTDLLRKQKSPNLHARAFNLSTAFPMGLLGI